MTGGVDGDVLTLLRSGVDCVREAHFGVRKLAFALGPGSWLPGRAEPRFDAESGSKLLHSTCRPPAAECD
jgi:hypothetical protein